MLPEEWALPEEPLRVLLQVQVQQQVLLRARVRVQVPLLSHR